MVEKNKETEYIEIVSHEIQTQLQVILANAENLVVRMTSTENNNTKPIAEQILYSIKSLATIVHSIGDYFQDYRFEPHALPIMIEESKNIYHHMATRKGVTIKTVLNRAKGKSLNIDCSKHHLQYALNNLIHNAVKYSFTGVPERPREVKIIGNDYENEYYCISIENYGVGILQNEIEDGLLFNEGYKGELTRGEFRSGAGKGLYYAWKVIDKHNGFIDVDSLLMADGDTLYKLPHLNIFSVYLPYFQPKKAKDDAIYRLD